jgi:hypothetical protein
MIGEGVLTLREFVMRAFATGQYPGRRSAALKGRGRHRAGNSVLVVEHDEDTILSADHVIDLGPEGGESGGRVVPWGPPAAVMREKQSHTGRFLRAHLGRASTTARAG